jgi:hypothetical protein
MIIPFEVLRAALNRLLDHAQEIHGEEIDLPNDLYWFVRKEDLYDLARTPTDLTLGALADDWAAVAKIGAGEGDPIGYDLVWASALLRAIGDRTLG